MCHDAAQGSLEFYSLGFFFLIAKVLDFGLQHFNGTLIKDFCLLEILVHLIEVIERSR